MVRKTNNIDQSDKRRLATNDQLLLTSFLGGPFGACYLVAQNYKALNHQNIARNWYLGIAILFLLFPGFLVAVVKFVPQLPYSIIPMFYTGLICGLFQHYQGEMVKKKLDADWAKYSWYKTIAITLLSLGLFGIDWLVQFMIFPSSWTS